MAYEKLNRDGEMCKLLKMTFEWWECILFTFVPERHGQVEDQLKSYGHEPTRWPAAKVERDAYGFFFGWCSLHRDI